MAKRKYPIPPISINGIRIEQVVIDDHYEVKHGAHINDALILEIVKTLDGREIRPEVKENEYSYFNSLIDYKKKQYRLIWLLEDEQIYVGVVNLYRDNRRQ